MDVAKNVKFFLNMPDGTYSEKLIKEEDIDYIINQYPNMIYNIIESKKEGKSYISLHIDIN